MRKTHIFLPLLISIFTITGCQKSSIDPKSDEVPQEVLNRIKELGFNNQGVYKYMGGYIVERDIYFDDSTLRLNHSTSDIIIANEEHYRTNLIAFSGPYTVSYLGNTVAIRDAILAAIARFNAENLTIQFIWKVPTSGSLYGDINVFNGNADPNGPIATSGFPSYQKRYPWSPFLQPLPCKTIFYNLAFAGWDANTMTSVIAHEIGHCIGFRHTDFMNRAFSGCLVDAGHPADEGAQSVGAVHIPGTPTTPDADSWMLACIDNGMNRPFTPNDRIALNFVY